MAGIIFYGKMLHIPISILFESAGVIKPWKSLVIFATDIDYVDLFCSLWSSRLMLVVQLICVQNSNWHVIAHLIYLSWSLNVHTRLYQGGRNLIMEWLKRYHFHIHEVVKLCCILYAVIKCASNIKFLKYSHLVNCASSIFKLHRRLEILTLGMQEKSTT